MPFTLWLFASLLILTNGLTPVAIADDQAEKIESLAAEIATLQTNLDHIWIMTTGGLIFLMQIGFMLLESGLVRSKNSISVAQKNLADFALSLTCFGALGFMVMFGPSLAGLIGFDVELVAFDEIDERGYAMFLFQAFFCGTAATIMSGVVAERMRLSAYLIVIPIIAVVIYPVFGHWAWGNLLHPENEPLLVTWGFVDFAGSTVVHSIGAWVGLAALLVIGPRLGRYDRDGRPIQIQGHSIVLATVGVFLLWIGWMGFNGGSTFTGSGEVSYIVANTMIAGAIGGVTGFLWGAYRDQVFRPVRMMNGILGGLVAVTAGCAVISSWGAVALGMTGALVALIGEERLEKHGLDDAVGAIAVHGLAGAWGTVGLALVAPLDALPMASRFDQVMVQIAGVALAFVWAFNVSFIMFRVVDRFWGLRISAADEMAGLNKAEHGATLGTGQMQAVLAELVAGKGDLRNRLRVEPGDEAAELVALFNQHMAKLESEQRHRLLKEQRHSRELEAALQKEKNLSDLQRSFVSMTSHEFRTPLAIIDGNIRRIERHMGGLAIDGMDKRIKTIREAIRRMLGLMESTLSAARLDSGEVKINPYHIDPRSILQACCKAESDLSRTHRIELDDQDWPETIIADAASLGQIFSSVLSNAVKYSPDADVVDVRTWQSDDMIFVAVKDQGLGIAEDDLPKIYDRYFRGQTITGIPGTGVGLSLSKLLIDRHDGSIDVTSRVGEGTEVTISLLKNGPRSDLKTAA